MKPEAAPMQLRPAIAEFLSRYSRRQATLAMVRAVSHAMVAVLVWLCFWGLVDRFILPIAPLARLTLLVGLAAITWFILRRPVARVLRRDVNHLSVARDIEAKDPRFNEILITVVSQTILPAGSLASPQLIEHLSRRLETRMLPSQQKIRPPGVPAGRATTIAAVGLAVFVSLFFWPRLGFSDLVLRQLSPFSGIAPVRTTRLRVEPGSIDVDQGLSQTITAWVEHLPQSTVILRTTTDGQNWTSVGMTPAADGSFTHTIAAVSRDLTYQVIAGDASSPRSALRVLRQPLVRDFRIRLIYPQQVARQPLTLTSTDGLIQAPVGTDATIDVNASEALKSATFVIGGQRLKSTATNDPRSRRIQVRISSDGPWELEMLSDRNVPGSGPPDMQIRAIPDRPPVVKFMMPEGSLLLRPHDTVRIPFQAADDYGLSALEARVSVNNILSVNLALPLGADPQRFDDSFILDLARCKVAIGDVVTVTLAGTDRAGQTSLAAPCRVLVSSEPVTPEQLRRVANLRDASRLGASMAQALYGLETVPDRSKNAAAKIATAAESATLMVRALLRSNSGAQDEQLCSTLNVLIDAAAVLSARLEQFNTRTDMAEVPPERLARVRENAEQLQTLVRSLWHGLSAQIILAERAALRAAPAPTEPGLVHLREDVDAEMHALGIDSSSSNEQAQLEARVSAAGQFTASMRPIDFAEAAHRWAAAPDPRLELFPERLLVAAQAEAVRGGGDLEWARDLQLASRASRAIEARTAAGVRESLAGYMDILWSEHQATRQQATTMPAGGAALHAAAMTARQALRAWAGSVASTRPDSASTSTSPRAPDVATTQETDSRERMLSVIRQAQESLAELPQELGRMEQAVQLSRQSQAVAQQAAQDAKNAPPDVRTVAERAAEIARSQSEESFDGLAEIAQELDPNRLHGMAETLRSFGPDASPAAASITQWLEPVLVRVHERIDARDPDGIDLALDDARIALSDAQDALRRARQTVLEKDPLVAALWFAQQQAAKTAPTSRPASTQPQNESLAILRRAWNDSIQRSADTRLSDPAAAPSTQPMATPSNSLRPWLDPDLVAGARDDDPPQFNEALRAYFKVLGQSDNDAEP